MGKGHFLSKMKAIYISIGLISTIFFVCLAQIDQMTSPIGKITSDDIYQRQKILENLYDTKNRKIAQELKTLSNHPWAGTYKRDFGFGSENLNIAPQAGFSYSELSCTGYMYKVGTVKEEKNSIKTKMDYPPPILGQRISELIPIRWGKRQYLIYKKEMMDFVNHINAGDEPCIKDGECDFYMRTGDRKISVQGHPKLPLPYSQYLLKKPIKAEMIDFHTSDTADHKREKEKKITIILNAGRSLGVFPGMAFYGIHPIDKWFPAIVIQVDEDRSIAMIDKFIDTNSSVETPKIGWQFSTKRRPD